MFVAAVSVPVRAQSLSSRIEAAGDGQVNFHFTGREGICGDGKDFMRIGTSYQGRYSDGVRSAPCVPGPVQVRISLDHSSVMRVETWVGSLRPHEGRDLGALPARESAEYLLGLAARANSRTGASAVLPAVLADSAIVWPTLLRLARDTSRDQNVRHETMFWLSRFASGAVEGRKNDPLSVEDGDDEAIGLKKHAVFVLSQLPHHDGVPQLIDVAQSGVDARVRSQALFWLGQSEDSRALSVFEAVLTGGKMQ